MSANGIEVEVDGLPVEVDLLAWRQDRAKVEDAVRGARKALRLLNDDGRPKDLPDS